MCVLSRPGLAWLDFLMTSTYIQRLSNSSFDFCSFQTGIPKDAVFLTADNQPVFPSSRAVEEVKNEDKIPAAKADKMVTTAADYGSFSGEKAKLIKSLNNQLVHPAKKPHIVWRQTTEMITIAISAPDVKDYTLMVKTRAVHFR